MKTQIISKIDPLTYYKKYIQSLEEVSDGEATGICPFCKNPDKTFEVVPYNKNFICYSCNIGGDPIKFFSLMEKKTEPAALRALAEEIGIEFNEDDPELVEKVEKVDVMDSEIFPLIDFPLQALPSGFRDAAIDIASVHDFNVGDVAGFMLGIVSGAIGNTIRVSPKKTWKEPIFLWIVIIADSGSGKSPLLNHLMRPIYRMEEGVNQARNRENPSDRHRMQYVVSDATVESLRDVFLENPLGIIVHCNELSGLIVGMDQYKGKGNDRQHYLELFDAKSWKINRVGQNIYIPHTGAAILGGIQTQILPKIFNEDSFNDGLIYRFLLMHPVMKPREFTDKEMTEESCTYWDTLLQLSYEERPNLNLRTCEFSPKNIGLDEGAKEIFKIFHNNLEKHKQDMSPLAKGFVPKLIGYSLRLAGVLHVIQKIEDKQEIDSFISQKTMEKAIRLVNYFGGQAIKALKIYSGQLTQDWATKHLIEIMSSLKVKVKNGRLPLKNIHEVYNDGIPDHLKIDNNKRIGTMLKKMGLKTIPGTGGLTYLIWDEEKIKSVLS